MALTIGDNFKYQANKPNFERDSFATLKAMKAYPETSIDDGHLSYCAETNKHYKFLSSNTVDETTGKWREFETTVGNNFPSDGIEGQYLKKANTGVKWDDGDVFYLNPRDFASGSITQAIYNKLVNAITNNKIIYIASNFNGENRAISPISSYYSKDTGVSFIVLMDDIIYNLHISPDLTFKQEEAISLDFGLFIQYRTFSLTSFNISGNTVTYSPTVISNEQFKVFDDAWYRHKLRLILRSFPETIVELFPIQFNSNDPTYPGGKYSFMGIFEYDGKRYTMILYLTGLSSADDRDWQLVIEVIPHFYIENSTFRNNQYIKRKEDNTYEWSIIEYPRIVLSEFSAKKFFGEYSMVVGADSIGWAGALLVDDFSSDKYRDFYCCMTYGQGIVIRHTYATDTYEYLNSFLADFSTTSSSYTQTNKMNSGGWGKVYEGSSLPLAYISRCSPDSNYIHTYYAYQIDTSVTPYNFVKKLTIKYGGSKLAAITSDITVDAEKKYLYIHGYKAGSADAITGTSLVMVFNLPEPGSSNTITLTDNDIVREFEFFVDEAAQDLHVSGGRLYYPYGGPNHHGLAVIDTSNGAILQDIDLTNISTNFIDSPEPEGVYVSNGNLYLNYHHSNTNRNEVCLVEFPLQEVKESIPVATTKTNGLMSAEDKTKLNSLNVDGGSTVVTDERALKGATMRFSGFVNGVAITQTGVNEWDSIVYDTSVNKFLAKKGTLTPTYHNVWSGMDAYMSDELGTSILKDKLYLYGEDIYKWSDSEGTLVKVTSEGSSTTPDIPLATQSTDGLMSSEDKTKLDNIDVDSITEEINDKRALNGTTMRFSSFVNGVTVERVGIVEFDSIVFDTAINKFLAKKNGTLSPTYYNVWQGMDAYMSDELGTSILKDKLYICDDVVYSWSDTENTLVKVDKEISNATQSRAGLMSAEDKAKLDNLNTSGEASDPRALNGATMRFNGFVSGVTIAQVGASEWDSIVYDTSINKFLAKKGTLSPTYYNIWSGMDAYMTDGTGTDILKDRLYLYGEDIYVWSNTEGTLIKVTPDIPNASQSEAGLMSAEDKTKLDNVISRIVLSEFSEKKFFGEFSKVTGASAIGWTGALFIDDFSSSEYRDFYCCMTYGQGIVIRHTYKTGVYEYLNSFIVDSSTTSSSYNITNKMNSGGWGKCYNNSELPLAYISRCSPNASYIHTYYAYKINRSVTPFAFERVLTIKYSGSKLAAITSDITIDAEKKYLYVHGYKSGSANAITGTSIVMVFNLPEPGSSDTVTLNDSDILWEFEFFVNEAAQDLCVSGGKLYYPYGSGSLHGLAVIDTKTGKIIQNLDLSTLSTNFIDNPEPEGVALSNGNVYLNYHHAGANNNEVCLVEFPLQEVKESIPVATAKSNGLLSSVDKEKLDSLVVLTKEEYDALEVKAENTIYFIKG